MDFPILVLKIYYYTNPSQEGNYVRHLIIRWVSCLNPTYSAIKIRVQVANLNPPGSTVRFRTLLGLFILSELCQGLSLGYTLRCVQYDNDKICRNCKNDRHLTES